MTTKAVVSGVCAIGAGCAAVAAVPPVLGAIGFTVGGIACGSLAAKLMSITAIWGSGGVGPGSLVAVLQSTGRCRECVSDITYV